MSGFEKVVSQKDSVKAFLVHAEDGKIDLNASVEKFREVALRHIANQEGEDGLILSCLGEVFDQYKGARMNVQAITSMTIQKMSAKNPGLGDPSLFSILSKRIAEVLRVLTGDEDNKPFNMVQGKAGGHYRKSDQVAKA